MSETVETKRRPGRPSKGKRGNFTFRVTEKLREQLVRAAAEVNLSVSEEIERQLDRCYSGKNLIEQLLGGRETLRLLMTMAQAIQAVEDTTGKKWTDDYETVAATKIAMKTIIDLMREPADNRPMSFANLFEFGPSDLGIRAAVDAVLEARKARAEALASGAPIPSKKQRRRRK
jgi:hypothetical protein